MYVLNRRMFAIIVVGTNQAAGKFAQSVELLGEHLPGRNNGKGITTVFFLDADDLIVRFIQSGIPVGTLPWLIPMFAYLGFQTTPG